MEVKGKIKLINDTEFIGENGFRKRLLVLETEDKYKNTVPIEFTQDKVELLDDFSEGDEVEVSINVGGQEWKGRYFASISGWKISKTDDAPAHKSNGAGKSHAEAMEEKAKKKESKIAENQEEEDNLPF